MLWQCQNQDEAVSREKDGGMLVRPEDRASTRQCAWPDPCAQPMPCVGPAPDRGTSSQVLVRSMPSSVPFKGDGDPCPADPWSNSETQDTDSMVPLYSADRGRDERSCCAGVDNCLDVVDGSKPLRKEDSSRNQVQLV